MPSWRFSVGAVPVFAAPCARKRASFHESLKEFLPSDISALQVDVSTASGHSTTTTNTTTTTTTKKSTIFNCQGVACTAAIQHAQNNDDDGSHLLEHVPSTVIDTCVATLPPPSLSAMASFNSFYDWDTYPNPEHLPTRHKRQCMYYYYAVHHFEGRGRRVCLPCCVRKKIHMTYPCLNSTCLNNCPTHHSDTFEDDFGFPKRFNK